MAEFLLKTVQTKRQWSELYKADREKPSSLEPTPRRSSVNIRGNEEFSYYYESSNNLPPAVRHYEKCFL